MGQKGGQPPVGFYSTSSLIQIAIFGHFWADFGSIFDDNFDQLYLRSLKSPVSSKNTKNTLKNHCFLP